MSSLRRAVRSVAPPTCVRRAGRPPPACHVLTAGSLAHHEPPPLCARCLVYVGVRSWPLRRARELPDIGASLRCSCSPPAASFVPRASSSGGVPSFSPFAGFRGVPVFHAFVHRHPSVRPLSARGETAQRHSNPPTASAMCYGTSYPVSIDTLFILILHGNPLQGL